MTLRGVQPPPAQIRDQVLVVESDASYATNFATFIERYGFAVTIAGSMDFITEILINKEPKILVMEQFVHGTDALVLLPNIRTVFSGAILVLSAESTMTDRILALEGGADDFMSKSLDFREILARLRALSRRTFAKDPLARSSDKTNPLPVISRHGWTVNVGRREVRTPDGTLIPLTGLEFDAFLLLFQSPGIVIEREELAIRVLRRPLSLAGRSLENLVSRIRNKFESYLDAHPFIKSVRGKGYVFLEFP